MSAPVVDSPLAKGTWVRIVGQAGVFKVMSNLLNADGSLTLYGGDKNPRGHRGYRAVMPSRLVETDSPYGEEREREAPEPERARLGRNNRQVDPL